MAQSNQFPRILWAEDEEDIRRAFDANLKGHGFRVVFAQNARQALALYEDERDGDDPFGLLVCDIAMPDETGLWLARQVRALGDDEVPIVFVTGFDGVMNKQGAEDVSAAGYIVKPVLDMDALCATIKRAMLGL